MQKEEADLKIVLKTLLISYITILIFEYNVAQFSK